MKHTLFVVCFTLITPLFGQREDFADIDLWRADYIAKYHQGEALTNLYGLVYKLTAQLPTEVEKFRAIYFWVSHNIEGDQDLMQEYEHHQRKYKNDSVAFSRWNVEFKKEVFRRLRTQKETLCTGYAFLIKEMAQLAGLECEIIYGFGHDDPVDLARMEFPNHTWNAVKLDGQWYLSDATWSSGFTDVSASGFKFDYDDSYFLMDPEQFSTTHRPLDEKWRLIPNSSGLASRDQ